MRLARTIILLTAILLLSVNLLSAQGLSLSGSLGYGLGRGGNDFTSSGTYDSNYNLTKVKDHYLSIGQGLKLEGSLQIGVKPNLALRLGGGYSTMLPSLEAEDNYADQDEPDTDTYNAHAFYLNSIVVLATDLGSLRPYAGAGGGLFFGSMTREGTSYYFEGRKYEDKVEYRFDPTIGFIGVLGVELPMGKSALFVELNLQQVSFTIKEYEVVKAQVDAQDVLDNVDVDSQKAGNQTTLEFEKNSVTAPTPWVMQGSSFGIRLGLRLGFK